MKLLILTVITFVSAVLVYSCKRELSCEGCMSFNRPPIANAGADLFVLPPTDTVLLNGSASTDSDGSIVKWQWKKLTGPASDIITNSDSAIATLKISTNGNYVYELTVTDNGGLTDTDTLKLRFGNPMGIGRPPVANAGKDSTINLPVNSILLDGSLSTDADNDIETYAWTKISGPAQGSLNSSTGMQVQATNLVAGTYEFVLMVTDAMKLFSFDTVRIYVMDPNSSCVVTVRPTIPAQLTVLSQLPVSRYHMSAAYSTGKIVFAGGYRPVGTTGIETNQVDIYNINTNNWQSSTLSSARAHAAAVTAGNKVFLGGGGYPYGDTYHSKVDIYNVTSNTWTQSAISTERTVLGGGYVDNKVFFAGGYVNPANGNVSATVDVYDIATNSWSAALLKEARADMSVITSNNRIYFAGGFSVNLATQTTSNMIDVYEPATNSWFESRLSVVRGKIHGASVGEHIYWAGSGCLVEIRNVNTNVSSAGSLSRAGADYCVARGSQVLFFSNLSNRFDIYNTTTQTWSIGIANIPIPDAASILVVNDSIYVAGGIGNDKLYLLSF